MTAAGLAEAIPPPYARQRECHWKSLMEYDLEDVAPVDPPAPWIGGKRRLAPLIVERLGVIPHRCYAEPFIGMGGIFFRRRSRPRAEVINDVNRELITLFRVLQHHYVAFVEMLRWQLASRAEFERLKRLPADHLTDLQRAARFLYLQRNAFGGKVAGQTFGVSTTDGSPFDITRIIPLLSEIHDRLAGVVIECLPYGDFITRYDSAETLFYLDPPYHGSEGDYGAGVFRTADFERLARHLSAIAGRFVLSINDVPEIRHTFRAFRMEEVRTTYSISSRIQPAAELIVTNAGEAPGRLL